MSLRHDGYDLVSMNEKCGDCQNLQFPEWLYPLVKFCPVCGVRLDEQYPRHPQ